MALRAGRVWGYVQRNYFLTKRYLMWEIVWLVYVTVNAMAITYIGAGVEAVGGSVDTRFLMTYLLVGALLWNYLSMLFDVLSETVSWERWEGTIEYTFMSPSSRVTHLLGMGSTRSSTASCRRWSPWRLLPVLRPRPLERELLGRPPDPRGVQRLTRRLRRRRRRCRSPRKGPAGQLHSLVRAAAVSGVYYEVDVLPGWMQAIATVSPVTYALQVRGLPCSKGPAPRSSGAASGRS